MQELKTSKQVKISKNGQVVVPLAIRKRLGLKAGDAALWFVRDGEAVFTSLPNYLKATQGILKGTFGKSAREIDDYISALREEWERPAHSKPR